MIERQGDRPKRKRIAATVPPSMPTKRQAGRQADAASNRTGRGHHASQRSIARERSHAQRGWNKDKDRRRRRTDQLPVARRPPHQHSTNPTLAARRQAGRQAGRQTDRQTGRQAHAHAHSLSDSRRWPSALFARHAAHTAHRTHTPRRRESQRPGPPQTTAQSASRGETRSNSVFDGGRSHAPPSASICVKQRRDDTCTTERVLRRMAYGWEDGYSCSWRFSIFFRLPVLLSPPLIAPVPRRADARCCRC